MKKRILILGLLFCVTFLTAQESRDTMNTKPSSSFNLGLFGDISLISINFEHFFHQKESFFYTGKLGMGFNQEFQICFGSCDPVNFFTLPHHATANWGNGKHFFEFGLGGTLFFEGTKADYLFYPILGYRFLNLKSKDFNFRAFLLLPFSGFDGDTIILVLPFGLSFGKAF